MEHIYTLLGREATSKQMKIFLVGDNATNDIKRGRKSNRRKQRGQRPQGGYPR